MDRAMNSSPFRPSVKLSPRVLFGIVAAAGLLACGDEGSGTGATSTGSGGSGGGFPEPFTVEAFDATRIGSDSNEANFQTVEAEVDFGAGPFEKATLTVTLATTCYPFETWKDNPPPMGENWPADCDAFDRNFETSLVPATEGEPALELVRAITPFGGPMTITEDITDVVNVRNGKQTIRIHITTYSDGDGIVSGSAGGWNVSAKVDLVPGVAPRNVLGIVPLYYASMTDPEGPGPLPFEIPEGASSARIDYRTTGHGGPNTGPGCSGPAEEFCRRDHELLLDDAMLMPFEPWRTDCEVGCSDATYEGGSEPFDYCLENPCGLPASVKASRANWCPGSVTPPLAIDLADAGAGAHTFSWRVPGLLEGGSWQTSANLFVFGP